MRRDMDLVRKIVLATADLPAGESLEGMDGVDDATFAMHAQWMQEAGLIEAAIASFMGGESLATVIRLTWDGCEFADAVASDTLWAKAKATVIKPSASFTFGVLRDWLKSEIQQGFPSIR